MSRIIDESGDAAVVFRRTAGLYSVGKVTSGMNQGMM